MYNIGPTVSNLIEETCLYYQKNERQKMNMNIENTYLTTHKQII